MGLITQKLRQLPNQPGVYWMKDRFGHTLYVGKAKNLKKRVSSYFQISRRYNPTQPKIQAMVELAEDLEWLTVGSEAEALLLEGKLIKTWKPKYNTDFTDDKNFLLVKVDLLSPLPQFRLVRNALEDGSRYFGPFAKAGPLRQILQELRKRFGILLGDAHPKRQDNGLYQLYDDARAEIYGQPNVLSLEDYAKRVEAACQFLEGKIRDYRKQLRESMQKAAESQAYEKAASLRDQLFALEDTLKPTRRFHQLPKSLHGNYQEALEILQKALFLKHPPRSIEGFDISHISGTFTVASMVRFEEGVPHKGAYRRFKIRSFQGNDDFRAMKEVLSRRYRRLNEEHKPFPDLILIDGGLGQVHAAIEAFQEAQLPAPPMIGLAKKEELIVLEDGKTLKLPPRNEGLKLLQRIRDEAHRFANSYNAALRSKKIRESTLEDVPGLGKKKMMTLLNHFKSLHHLRMASLEDLSQVAGIGPKLAQNVFSFFRKKDSIIKNNPNIPPNTPTREN